MITYTPTDKDKIECPECDCPYALHSEAGCSGCDVQVVRPGKFQCVECGK